MYTAPIEEGTILQEEEEEVSRITLHGSLRVQYGPFNIACATVLIDGIKRTTHVHKYKKHAIANTVRWIRAFSRIVEPTDSVL